MGILTDQLNEVQATSQQAKDLLQAHAKLREGTVKLISLVGDIQTLIDGGKFDNIPNELRTELLQWFNYFKQIKIALEDDVGIVELYGP